MPAASTREGSRRQHERVAVDVRVDLSPDATARFDTGRSSNVAEGGMFVATDALLRVDARIGIGFMVDDGLQPVRGEARVVWVREEPAGDGQPAGVGLEFQSFEEDGADRVSRWCTRLREQQPVAPPPPPPRAEVVSPAEESRRTEVFDGTGVFLTRGVVESKTPRTDVFVVDDALDDTAALPGRPGGRRGRALWLAAAVVILALVVAALLERDRLAGWFERLAARDEPATVETLAAVGSAPEPSAGEIAIAVAGEGTSVVPPEPEAAAGRPAVLEVTCQDRGDTSLAVVRLSAPVAVEQVTLETLADPPRILLRLVGVTGDAEGTATASTDPRVREIRTGLHADLTPPEVHVVLDLADPATTVLDWWIENDAVDVVLGTAAPQPAATADPEG